MSVWVSLENKQLKKELLAPATGRSRVGELNPRQKDQNRSQNKSDRDKIVSAEETSENCAHAFHFSTMANQQTKAF